MVPHFLNIGAQKCATTWLYYCLKEHPEVFLSPKNRVVFFEQPDYSRKNWDWYLSHFAAARQGQVIGDARVEYLYNPETPELIARHLPDCKLVVILRNPVDRAVSAFHWYVRKGLLPDLPLDEGMRAALEGRASLESKQQDELFRGIVGMGRYAEQLDRYFKHFEQGRFLILLYDDVKTDPAGVYRSVCRFVGINAEFMPKGLGNQPLRSAGIPALKALERQTRMIYGSGKIWDWVNRAALRVGLGREGPRLGDQTKRALQRYYAPHNLRLAAILREYRSKCGHPPDHLRLERCEWLNSPPQPKDAGQ